MCEHTLSVIKFFNLPYAQVFLTRITCTCIRCTKSFMAPMTHMFEPKSKDGTGKLGQGNWQKFKTISVFPSSISQWHDVLQRKRNVEQLHFMCPHLTSHACAVRTVTQLKHTHELTHHINNLATLSITESFVCASVCKCVSVWSEVMWRCVCGRLNRHVPPIQIRRSFSSTSLCTFSSSCCTGSLGFRSFWCFRNVV